MSIIPTAYQIALQNARKATTAALEGYVARRKPRVRVKASTRPATRDSLRAYVDGRA